MNSLTNKPTTECGNCGFKDRWLLHYVRLRGEHRRLCTSCVLKLHPGSFCSICFELFEGSVPQHERVVCQKCSSITHPGCVGEDVKKCYNCPSCKDPKFRFFDVKRDEDDRMEIDLKSAKVLLCAARISSESMSRAVNVAEADASRRVKEAAVSRKRAKEALEEMCAMVGREKARKVREDGISSAGGLANGVDRNGVVGNNRDRMVAGGSSSVPGSLSNVGLQNVTSNRGVVLGSSGNSSINRGDDKRGKTSNGVAGRSTPVGTSIQARPMNVGNAGKTGNADAGRSTPAGTSILARPMNVDSTGKTGNADAGRSTPIGTSNLARPINFDNAGKTGNADAGRSTPIGTSTPARPINFNNSVKTGNKDAGRSTPMGTSTPARPMNVDNAVKPGTADTGRSTPVGASARPMKVDNAVKPGTADTGRSTPAGTSSLAIPMDVDTTGKTGDANGKHESSSPSRPAEDSK